MPIRKIRAIGTGIKNALKAKFNETTSIKRLKANLRSIERAFNLLHEYYSKAKPYNVVKYGPYGTISLLELKKHHLDEPFFILSDRKFRPAYIKRAYRILKIKSIDVTDKTNSYLITKIEDSFRTLKNAINENITQKLSKINLRKSTY
jgi:hypothetical protein